METEGGARAKGSIPRIFGKPGQEIGKGNEGGALKEREGEPVG